MRPVNSFPCSPAPCRGRARADAVVVNSSSPTKLEVYIVIDRSAGHQIRTAPVGASNRSMTLRHEERLKFLELGGIGRRQVLRLADIIGHVVQLLHVFDQRMPWIVLSWCLVDRAREPAVMIDATVAQNVVILRLVTARSIGVSEGIGHGDAARGAVNARASSTPTTGSGAPSRRRFLPSGLARRDRIAPPIDAAATPAAEPVDGPRTGDQKGGIDERTAGRVGVRPPRPWTTR
jgi:hypothetical protein